MTLTSRLTLRLPVRSGPLTSVALVFVILSLFSCFALLASNYRWSHRNSFWLSSLPKRNLPLPKAVFSSQCDRDPDLLPHLQAEYGLEIGSFFHDFIEMQRKIMCDPSYVNRRFLIFRPSAGMCNRLQGIVSAFLMAAMSRRALLVDWHITTQFACNYETLWRAPPFDWNMSKSLLRFHHIWLQDRAAARKSSVDNDYDVMFHSVNRDWLVCGNLTEHLGVDSETGEQLTFVKISTDESFSPLLVQGFHGNELKAVFGEQDPFVPGPSAYKFLLQPRSDVMALVETFKRENFPQGCDIGIHVRNVMLFGNEIEEFGKCAARYDSARSVFISSDNTTALARVKQGIRNHTSHDIKVVHLSQQVLSQSRQGCAQLREALTELILLSSCRVVIGTSFSSFSMLAMALSSEPANNMMVANMDKNPVSGALRNGCFKQHIKYPCYSEMRHFRRLSCFTPEMFESDNCCHYGFCGTSCMHHGDWNWVQNLLFYWKVWYPRRYLYQAGLISVVATCISLLTWTARKSWTSAWRVLRVALIVLTVLMGLTNAILFKVIELYLRP